jgi:hypothetical protein
MLVLAGCTLTQPHEERTAQVPASPFAEPRRAGPARIDYVPASRETSYRVLMIKDRLIDKNPQLGLKPYAVAIAASQPEVFHVENTIYVTEGLVQMCSSDNQLAGALAFELGRMVAARESAIADEMRQPERPLPIHLPIGGGGNAREADPLHHIDLIKHEKEFPRQAKKLVVPNPQHVARIALENAGFQRTDLDAVLPIIASAERVPILENQLKGNQKQSEWKLP